MDIGKGCCVVCKGSELERDASKTVFIFFMQSRRYHLKRGSKPGDLKEMSFF